MIAVTESHAVMSNSARDQAVYFAKLAEQAERYDEMANHLTVSELGDELSTEQRNLLPVVYKNAVDSRRAPWRIITSVERKEKPKSNSGSKILYHKMAGDYRPSRTSPWTRSR